MGRLGRKRRLQGIWMVGSIAKEHFHQDVHGLARWAGISGMALRLPHVGRVSDIRNVASGLISIA